MLRAAIAILLLALPAGAGTISGSVIDKANGAVLSGMRVRLWTPVYDPQNLTRIKSWTWTATTTTSPTYFFSGLSGPCLIDTLPAPGSTFPFEYTDRWYSPGEDSSDTVGFVDATQLDGNVDHSSIDVYVLRGGGIDGTLLDPAGSRVWGVFLRAELAGTTAIHHNDVSQGPGSRNPEHPGEFSFRGLVPSGLDAYQLLGYSLPGDYETAVLARELAVPAGVNITLPTVAMAVTAPPPGADPYNGRSHDIAAAFPLGRSPHSTFQSSVDTPSRAAIIAPLGSDLDSFCFPANEGDRFRLEARSAAILGTSRVNPWFDPILQFAGPGLPIAGFPTYDDDSGGGLDALIPDTGELPGGPYCARVSAFGDANFTGAGNSTGRFDFTATLLNRRPTILLVVPAQPAWVEGGTVTINLSFHDADGDPLTVNVLLIDAAGNTVLPPPLVTATQPGSAVFTWTIPQPSAGPYVATFTATDAPMADSFVSRPVSQTIAVAPLTVPVQVAPSDGARVSTATPAFQIQDLPDQTQTNISYAFELYDHTGALMAQSGSVPLDPGGHMSFVPLPLPENELVSWRVRAVHGTQPAYSAWTGLRRVLIDTVNEPPPDPVLVKPADGEEVMVRQPGFAATSEADPEGDAVSLVFELSANAGFTPLIDQSDPVGVTLANKTTPWTTSKTLAWSTPYWARVYAVDAKGAHSGYSNAVSFAVRADGAPAATRLAGSFDAQCQGLVLHAAPPSIRLGNVQDPDGEPVTLELQLLDFAGDPATAAPLLDVTRLQDAMGGTTAMDTSTMSWTEDAHYRARARAGDGTLWSAWSECDFTLDQQAPPATGGTPDAGPGPVPDGGPTTPPDGTHRKGCSTGGASGPALLLLAALALLRKRRQLI